MSSLTDALSVAEATASKQLMYVIMIIVQSRIDGVAEIQTKLEVNMVVYIMTEKYM